MATSKLFESTDIETAIAVVKPTAVVETQLPVGVADKLSALSEQDRRVLDATKKLIVPGDFGSISKYAQSTTTLASTVVDSVLKVASSSELDHIGGGVNKILLAAKQVDASKLAHAPSSNWFKHLLPWFFVTKERIIAQFSSVGTQIESYSKEIESVLKATVQSIQLMQNMEVNCKQIYAQLEVAILAGKLRTVELQQQYERQKAELASTPQNEMDPLKTEELQRLWQFIDTLEKQVSAQEQHQQVIYMQLPQLAMMVKNAVDASVEFRQILDLTIPLWKTQFTQALLLEQQRKSNVIIEDTKNFNNTLLLANADNLKTSTLKIQEQSARGLVDRETLEYVQAQFIQTIEGAVAIHTKARESREQLSQSIEKMRIDFKTSISSAH